MKKSSYFKERRKKKFCIMLFLILVFNIAISLWINPVKNLLISDDFLDINSLNPDNSDYVYFEGNQIIFKETVETRVAYAYLDVDAYDYLQVDIAAYPVNGQCRVYVDISGNNSEWDTSENFYSVFYSDIDNNNTLVSGSLDLGKNHSGIGTIRIMNDAGVPLIVRSVHISGWKFYKLSNYSIVMLMLLSVIIIFALQKAALNSHFVPFHFIEAIVAFASVNAFFGGLLNDLATSSNSLTAMINVVNKFIASDLQYTWVITAFCIVFLYAFLQIRKVALHNYSTVSSYVFSFLILSGYMYDKTNIFFELYYQKYFWLICLFIITGLAWLIQCVMRIIHIFINYLITHSDVFYCSRKKCFFIVWAIITFAWLPHLIIRYPAAIHWDSAVQIEQVLKDSVSTFWPVVSTLLMGKAVEGGNLIFGSYNLGIFLYSLIQTVICSAIFAYGISLLTEFKINRIYIWIATFICSFVPVFSAFTTSVSKDVPFSNLAMLFLLMLLETLKVKNNISIKYGATYVIVTILVMLFSNKGLFYVLASVIGTVVFLIRKKEKRYWQLLVILIISYLSSQLVQTGINSHYEKTSTLNVTLCQPLQDIGYYTIKYEDEWSEEDKKLIDKFLIYEEIADSYRMDMADGMFVDIWRYENKHSIKEICQLVALWCKGFIKHPDCYMDATLRCNFGFYYPDTKQWGNYNSGYYIGDPNVPNTELPFTYSESLQTIITKLSKIILYLENLPILYLFNSIAISVWIQIFVFLYMLCRKKWEEMFCVLVSLVSFALCLIGPTYYCGGARYALVSVFFNIFLVGYWINDRYGEKNTGSI